MSDGEQKSRSHSKAHVAISAAGRGLRLAWREYHFLIPPSGFKRYFSVVKATIKGEPLPIPENENYYDPMNLEDYNEWIAKHDRESEPKKFKYNPLISIVIPVYNIGRTYLEDCLDSILDQTYQNFEVCLADDCSTKPETLETLKKYEKNDSRIKVVYRKKNGHISKATNSAIKIAKGEFIALMDDDDVLTKDALHEVVKVLNKDEKIDMIYSDEDKMEVDGTFCEPNFKPDYSPDTLLGGNYICHFSVFRKSIIDKIGGFRDEFVGAQDFDLILRVVEQTDRIYHIPKILYHWRKVPGSTAVKIDSKSYAVENGRKAVEEALARRGLKGKVTIPINAAYYNVKYNIENNPLVSIIIPTKDNARLLKRCLRSIYRKTSYKNFEIIIVNNRSEEKATYKFFEYCKKKYSNLSVLEADFEFNYPHINNLAVEEAKGEYILLLNNDTRVLTRSWLEEMLGYASQKHVGAVGVKLLYPDKTVQHGGVVLGVAGIAVHAYLGEVDGSYGVSGRLLIPYDYGAVTGACLMVSKKKYLEVGGLDENLAVAYNDIDFCIKLLERGYYNVFLPQVKLIHYESKTRGSDFEGDNARRLDKEAKYMKKKWGESLVHDRFYNPNYSLEKVFLLDKKV